MDMSTRLEAVRLDKGWSVTELAKRADLNKNHVWKICHGQKPGMAADTVVALAKALRVSTDYLLGLTDDKDSYAQP